MTTNTVKVKLVRSLSRRKSEHVATAQSLGLKRIGDVVEVKDNPSQRGMIKSIEFLLEVVDKK